MRTLPTILLGALFVLCFTAFFLIDSIGRYITDRNALVGSAREAELRGSLVEATTELIVTELESDPLIRGIDRGVVRAAVAHVLSEAWMEETLRKVHGAALKGAAGMRETAVLELGDLKQALRRQLSALEGRAIDSCRLLFGARRCADRTRARRLLDAYQTRAGGAIERLPERIELAPDARRMRGADLDVLRTARWAGLALLVLLLAGIILINRRPTARLCGATGATLAVAAALFLTVVFAARLTASGEVADRLFARVELEETAGEPGRIAAQGLRRLGSEIVADATRGAAITAGFVGAAGLGLALLGGLAGRQSRPSE